MYIQDEYDEWGSRDNEPHQNNNKPQLSLTHSHHTYAGTEGKQSASVNYQINVYDSFTDNVIRELNLRFNNSHKVAINLMPSQQAERDDNAIQTIRDNYETFLTGL